MKKYLAILWIWYWLSKEEINLAYKKMAMKYHPDRNHGFKEESEKKMKDLNEARDYILNNFDEYTNYKWESYEKEEKKEYKEEKREEGAQERKTESNYKNTENKKEEKVVENEKITRLKKVLFFVVPFIVLILAIELIFFVYSENLKNQEKERLKNMETQCIQNGWIIWESWGCVCEEWFILWEDSKCININTDLELNEKELLDNMFKFYCNTSKIKSLYWLAPNSEYYNSFVKNKSDIPSQKVIASILLSQRWLYWQDELLKKINNSLKYKKTILLLVNSDNNFKKWLENIKNVESYEEFKSNFNNFLKVWIELFNNIPSEFIKEYDKKLKIWSWDLLTIWELMCNNNVNISFWDDRLKNDLNYDNSTNLNTYVMEILQNVNLRENPWNWKIIKPILKWEKVNILSNKVLNWDTRYNIDYNGINWWISSIWFLLDNTKASAVNIITNKYAWEYKYWWFDDWPSGNIKIFPNSDKDIQFYLDLNRGFPSYNMWALLWKIDINAWEWEFYSNEYWECKFKIKLNGNNLELTTIENKTDCWFWFWVYLDWKYDKISEEIPFSYISIDWTNSYFINN